MKKTCSSIALLLLPLLVLAEVNVRGTVLDRITAEPIAGASLIIKGANGQLKKFSSSKPAFSSKLFCCLMTNNIYNKNNISAP